MGPGIGSDFHLDLAGKEVALRAFRTVLQSPSDRVVIYTDSGRSAIRLALRTLRLGSGNAVLVPSYICESVLNAVAAEGVRPILYGVDENLQVMLDSLFGARCPQAQAVLVVDYFGFDSNLAPFLEQISGQGLRIIYDCSHSLLGMRRASPVVDVYVASLRKLLPIPDGGLVLLRSEGDSASLSPLLDIEAPHAPVRMAAMMWKGAWVRQPIWPQPPFRELFLQAEMMLDKEDRIYGISSMSSVLLKLLSVDNISKRRRSNFLRLLRLSKGWPTRVVPMYGSITNETCPLGFPVIVDRRDDLRSFLIDHRIYPPVHWSLDERVFGDFPDSVELSKHILTLPCDHRYGPRDMRALSNAIVQWGYHCV
jgi:dTDP-4-amino-4,6-dideoxygalactose transaminase